jgi:hypothetical protein
MAGLSVCLVAIAALVVAVPAQAQDPIGGALATLAAATANAQAVRAAQQSTAAAISAEAARQANIAQATARALSAEGTRQSQSVQATTQAQSAQATQGALDELNRQRAATAAAEYQAAQSTRQAQHAMATSQAVMVAAQATDAAQLSATYATRQARFSFGLLLVEIAGIAGALWVLWKLARTLAAWADRMRPRAEPVMDGDVAQAQYSSTARVMPSSGIVIDAVRSGPIVEPARAEPRMPSFVQVVDNPRIVEAIEQWAKRYDKEHGVSYGNGNE